jgi:hypothetical protein
MTVTMRFPNTSRYFRSWYRDFDFVVAEEGAGWADVETMSMATVTEFAAFAAPELASKPASYSDSLSTSPTLEHTEMRLEVLEVRLFGISGRGPDGRSVIDEPTTAEASIYPSGNGVLLQRAVDANFP